MPSKMSLAKGPENVEELAARLDREFDEFLDKMIKQSHDRRQSETQKQTYEEIAAVSKFVFRIYFGSAFYVVNWFPDPLSY